MKKLLLVLPLLVLLTGCGKDKLSCSMEENGKKVEINVNFKDKKPESIESIADADTKEEAQALCALAKTSESKNNEIKCDGKKVTMIEKVADENHELYGKTKDEIKKVLTDAGYTCK